MDRLTDKLSRLERRLGALESAVVAYSGGVDSAFLAVVCRRALGDRMAAALGVSPSVARREMADALRVARDFGIPLREIPTREMDNPLYVANRPDRCFHCKDELFGALGDWARTAGFRWVLDGTHLDDQEDDRPGRRAAAAHGVRSPLLEMGWTKDDIREGARDLGIAIWDKPSSPCLASRIPHGSAVRIESLGRIERAEESIRALGFRDLRVRAHGDLARIELMREDISRLLDEGLRQRVLEAAREAGFEEAALDATGYRRAGASAGGDP